MLHACTVVQNMFNCTKLLYYVTLCFTYALHEKCNDDQAEERDYIMGRQMTLIITNVALSWQAALNVD